MPEESFSTAQTILQEALGSQAVFREGQWEAIAALAGKGQRLVVVQRTGWGKSLVYFIATRLNRLQNGGMTILVSPLLSLMRNQIEQAEKFGLAATRLDSTNLDEHDDIIDALLHDEVDLLLISPERLANETFRSRVWSQLRKRIGMLVVDEVHCISDWGHDFRPDYRRVLHILSELPPETAVLGTTATANTRVIEDVKAILGGNVQVSRGSLMRESLRLYTFPEPRSTAYRLELLSYLLESIQGTGIIYCSTTRDCEIVARWLQSEGYAVEAYHSKVDSREELERKLLHNEVKALAASVALGMGFDKPDLSFVIHYQLPGSIISYYQQIGRAGRGISKAHIILMRGTEDRDIQEYFINNAFPPIETMVQAAQHFQHGHTLTLSDIEIEFNLSRASAEKVLQQLEIEGFIARTRSGYRVTRASLPDFERWRAVTQKRYHELEQMEAFAQTQDCLMWFLANALEDPTHPQSCGRCKNCTKSESRFESREEDFVRAQTFLLKGDPIVIEPRKRWAGRNVITKKANLEHLNEPGLALSFYNDEGWGKRVKAGKYTHGRFDDALVQASAELIDHHWRGQLQWITSIPSTRHPMLVPDFSRRLAESLRLPYIEAIHCINPYPEQKTVQNSHWQLRNIVNAFSVRPDIPRSPVLLVDDIIDSGWSLTLIGWLLRERQHVEQVFPFVLAKAMRGSL